MFGTFAHPTPAALLLWAIWAVAHWRIAHPEAWLRVGAGAVVADPSVEPLVSGSPRIAQTADLSH